MSLIQEINARNIEAMKQRDTEAKTILGIVKNNIKILEIEKRVKNEEVQDADVLKIIQKVVKSLEEEISAFASAGRDEQVQSLNKQKSVVEAFLPQMMSEDEIAQIIAGLEDKSIGAVMKHFKENYNGKCDMSIVNKMAKNN